MKKHRKSISQWENTFLRRLTLIALLTVSPVLVLLQILLALVMQGVPETWRDIKALFGPNGCPAIRQAWMGQTNYRKWLTVNLNRY
jgi:hypothetical protein